MGADLLTGVLAGFAAVMSLGMHNAAPATMFLFRVFATIEIAALGIWWLYSRDNNMGTVIFRLITLAAFLWLMQHWQLLAGAMQASFMKLGIILGGNQLEVSGVHGAGMALITKGYELSLAIQGLTADPAWWEQIGQALAAASPTTSPVESAKWVTSWLVWFTFLLAGIHMFATQLEFVFFSAIAFITIPFACWHRTAWIAERTFGGVVGSGLKVAVLYMLASASIPILKVYVSPIAPSQQDAMHILGVGFLLLCLQWGAHKLASGMVHGTPSFTHSDVLPRLAPVVSLGTTALVLGSRLAMRMASRGVPGSQTRRSQP